MTVDMAVEGTPRRIVAAADTLFRRRGYAGTKLTDIAAASGTQIGSIYHFFRGKEAIAEEVIRTGGVTYGMRVSAVLADGPRDPGEALIHAFARAADDMAADDYADPCPVATLAAEVADTHPRLREAAGEVFDAWVDGLAAWCGDFIDDPVVAHDFAAAILAAMEGAFLLCRTRRTPDALLAAGAAMAEVAGVHRDRATRPGDTRKPRRQF